MERLHKDVIANREFYLKLRKEYDRITLYDNVITKSKE